jgi:tyrosine-protein phosphatase YwqE
VNSAYGTAVSSEKLAGKAAPEGVTSISAKSDEPHGEFQEKEQAAQKQNNQNST